MAEQEDDAERRSSTYRRAGELFDELAELEEDERAAAIARAARLDPEAAELAARMLERDSPAGHLAFLSGTTSPPHDGDPAGVLGTTIGPYVLESLLGRGGMGAVYLARRSDPDARVAIKFITLDAAPAAALERFKSEARLLARLEHPGVVRYRDSGVDGRGRPYLAMDFVDGQPLSWQLDEIAREPGRAVAVVAAIAEAVHHLHQRRVMHRDLKPSNVLVKRAGNALVPIVIDLGIARALADPGLEGTDAGLTGALGLGPVGTPSFMSPEQARADAPPDVRTDVHALGALLYALLTGHPPRELDSVAANDPLEFHRRLQEREARPPSRCVDPSLFGEEQARRRARRIDSDLDAVVLKAVALDPDERYGSAEALAADLLRWMDRLPVSARLVGPLGRLRRLVRRRPVEALVGAAAGVVLATALVATLVSRVGELEAQERYAEQLLVSRELNRFFTEDLLLRAMPELDGPEMPVIELLRAAAASSASRDDRPPVVTVAVSGALMEVFERLGASREADAELARAGPLVDALARDDPQRLLFETQRATLLVRRSRWAQAEAAFREVVAQLEREPGVFPEIELRAANGLGHVLISLDRLDEAEVWLTRALRVFDEELAGGPAGSRDGAWEILANSTLLASTRGDPQATVAAFEDLLVALDSRFGPETPYALGVRANLAGLLLDLRRLDEAQVHAREAVRIADRLFEPTHPDRLTALNQLASCLSLSGAVDEALPLRREVYAGRLERLGPDNSSTGVALNNLASTLVRASRAAEARSLAEEALATLVDTLGEDHPSTAGAYLTLAAIEESTGATGLALELYDVALDIYERADGDHGHAIEQARLRRAAVE